MRVLSACAVFVAFVSLACGVEEIGLGEGSIVLHNADPTEVTLLVSDGPECVLGMHSSLSSGSTRDFPVGETTYLCVGENPPGFPVQDGGSYRIQGGAVVPEP